MAVNHQIQPALIMSMSTNGRLEAFERDQKERFGQLLREQIRNRGVQFVGEEARYGEDGIAQRVCGQEGCRYVNIDMTPEERRRRNIPPGYYEDGSLPEAEKNRCNQEREEYMSNETIRGAGRAESILVICGRLHAESIAGHLRKLGHAVEITDLRDHGWYVEDWFGHIMRNL